MQPYLAIVIKIWYGYYVESTNNQDYPEEKPRKQALHKPEPFSP